MWIHFLLYACISQEPTLKENTPSLSDASQENMREHVQKMSSDDFLGRGTFEPGLDMAAAYIAAEFQKYGLKSIDGRDSYISTYPLYRYSWETNATLSIGSGVVPNTQWRPYKFENKLSEGHEVHVNNVPLVFVGYGIDASEQDWNDYKNVDVRGKVVVVMRRKPESIESEEHATFARKAEIAQENGAIGMVVFTDPSFPEDRLKRGDGDFRKDAVISLESFEENDKMNNRFRNVIQSSNDFASVRISPELIDPMFPDHSLSDIQEKLDKGESPATIAMNATTISLDWTEADLTAGTTSMDIPNVIGMIEGTDPELQREMVVVGAHFDHLGAFETNGDGVFNGADDNASGTSALLELARLFSEGDKPKRTIIFAAFSAEELGLLGSKAFTKQIDMDAVAFMINFDMIGRNSDKPLSIIGDGFSTEMQDKLAPMAETIGLPLEFTGTDYFGASDHDHWYRANRPFLFFFAGLHDDYHRLSDHIEHLDFTRMQQTASLGFQLIRLIADGEYTPKFIAAVDWLGISLIESEQGVVVQNVDEYGKGIGLGFQTGDVIVIEDAEKGIIDLLQSLKPEETARLSVKRTDQDNTIEVIRHKSAYMGVYPEEVSEEAREANNLEKGVGLVLNVADDGPADKSGFQDGDVLLKIGAQAVGESGESEKRFGLTTILKNYAAEDAVECLALRDGEQITINMVFGERPSRR